MLFIRFLVFVGVCFFVLNSKAGVRCFEVFDGAIKSETNVSPFEKRLSYHLDKPGVFNVYQKYYVEFTPIIKAFSRLSEMQVKSRNQFIDDFVVEENFSSELKLSFTSQAYSYRYVYYGFASLGRVGRHLSVIVPSILDLRRSRKANFSGSEAQSENRILKDLERFLLEEVELVGTRFNKLLMEVVEAPSADLVLLAKLEDAQMYNVRTDLNELYKQTRGKVNYLELLQQLEFVDKNTPDGQQQLFLSSLISKVKKKELYSDQ